MMKKILAGVLLALTLGLAAFAASNQNRDANCYTVVVGKKVSADGSVIVAHNEDERKNGSSGTGRNSRPKSTLSSPRIRLRRLRG